MSGGPVGSSRHAGGTAGPRTLAGMPASPPDDRADDALVVEGKVVDAPREQRPRPAAPRIVDAWTSVAPKQATRTMTLLALLPLLVLPLALMGLRLPIALRPVLAVLAVAATGYAFWRLRRPVKRAYRVDTSGLTILTQHGEVLRLPFDSAADLRIELSGDGPGVTALVLRPRGPIEAGSRAVRTGDGSLRLGFPQHDAARLDAAIRAAGAAGYAGIVRR